MTVDLEGAVACVTGGARGIGRETAVELAGRGAQVWIGDLDADEAGRTAEELGELVRASSLDVGDRKSFADFLAAVEAAAGPPDVLVNNAGIMPLGPFLTQDEETSQRTIAVNLVGVINGMRLALPGMLERGRGHVVNVASMMAKLPVPGAAVYTATKHAVLGLTGVVRAEISDSGVTLSTVLPSIVRTELISGIPLPRGVPTVDPEDVARAIADSCDNGRHEIHVPRWLGAYDAVEAALPGRAMGAVRRLLDDRRALDRLDAQARADYDRRTRQGDAS
jgi:NAD(P)-dependent dehydrogenase (short-subunit alcohol dehydrogenase family)